MSWGNQQQKLDQGTVRKIFDYLFGKGKEMTESQYMDMRTRIKGREMFGALLFYRIFDEHFECETAEKVANIIERMSISDSGGGRGEGVIVLSTPNLPKEVTLLRGLDPMLSKEKKE